MVQKLRIIFKSLNVSVILIGVPFNSTAQNEEEAKSLLCYVTLIHVNQFIMKFISIHLIRYEKAEYFQFLFIINYLLILLVLFAFQGKFGQLLNQIYYYYYNFVYEVFYMRVHHVQLSREAEPIKLMILIERWREMGQRWRDRERCRDKDRESFI